MIIQTCDNCHESKTCQFQKELQYQSYDANFVFPVSNYTRLKLDGILHVCGDCGEKIKTLQKEVWERYERKAADEMKKLILLKKLKQ